MGRPSALIGCTGFVGRALLRAASFDDRFHRSDIDAIRGRCYARVVCAGLPAEKWRANREPEADRSNMEALWRALAEVECERLVLVSTIDVYGRAVGVDEHDEPDPATTSPYGRHRAEFERLARSREGAGFGRVNVVRLPGLFGEGLRKNLIFDLLHHAAQVPVHADGRLQWYPIEYLADDIERAVALDLDVSHLFCEPIATRRLLDEIFPAEVARAREIPTSGPAPDYDAYTRYAREFGGSGRYRMSAAQVLHQLHRFVAAQRAASTDPA